MKLSDCEKYWEDEFNNKWSCEHFSKDEAKYLSHTLLSCHGCVDCGSLKYCVDCNRCVDCEFCIQCTKLFHSKHCIQCDQSFLLEKCFMCTDCLMSSGLLNRVRVNNAEIIAHTELSAEKWIELISCRPHEDMALAQYALMLGRSMVI